MTSLHKIGMMWIEWYFSLENHDSFIRRLFFNQFSKTRSTLRSVFCVLMSLCYLFVCSNEFSLCQLIYFSHRPYSDYISLPNNLDASDKAFRNSTPYYSKGLNEGPNEEHREDIKFNLSKLNFINELTL